MTLVLPVLFLAFSACNKPKGLQFKGFQDFDVKPLSFTNSRVSFGISVFNPNKFDIRINHLDAAISLAGNSIGVYQLDSLITLPASQPFVLPVQLVVKNGALLSNVLSVVAGDSLPYTLSGKVRAGRKIAMAEIPFSYSGHLNQNDFNGSTR
ncbi:MAG: LEA type 2 family protein [Bacteroidota bacterium]